MTKRDLLKELEKLPLDTELYMGMLHVIQPIDIVAIDWGTAQGVGDVVPQVILGNCGDYDVAVVTDDEFKGQFSTVKLVRPPQELIKKQLPWGDVNPYQRLDITEVE